MQIEQRASARVARAAVFMIFVINGAMLANWVARIPAIRDNLALSEGQLGLVLLGLSVGTLFTLPLAGGLIARYGSRRMTSIGIVLNVLAVPPLALAPSPITLAGALFLFGMATSLTDMAMNAQGVAVESRVGRPLMSSFHAGFSVGNFTGAALGSVLVALGLEPLTHFLLVSTVMLVLALFVMRGLIDADDRMTAAGERPPVFVLPGRPLWGLGVVAFCAAIGEGAMADWSAVYLNDIVGTTEAIAAWGFASFSLLMTVGRLIGDNLSARFGAVRVVRLGGALAAFGLGLALLWPETVPALIGFGLVGFGLANGVPLAFGAAGRVPGVSPGVGLAGVATLGYTAFLAGPPVIGLLAEATSLRLALILIAVLAASLVVSGRFLDVRKKQS